ncbi:MAG: hypothetical protein B7O98_05445 [Zestosphaera tikiterensis]|uniref:NFACT RNA-binding domain-containing protein n=1 Tax=Zestosphaera tikiterensis TaxID=1973259 RepID=A0A2R7Y5J5_9CREN|nr:MAG: hypothetical protein B7O98_05445 [Zestosphaera tikiterensis]
MSGQLKIKKSLTALDVAVIAKELNSILTNSLIDNVYGLEDVNSLLLKLKLANGEITYLIIEGGSRINLTRHITTGTSKGRVGVFRRYLRGGRVYEVSQYGFERILEMYVKSSGKDIKIVVELLPRGVISVVEKDTGKVLVNTVDLNLKDRVLHPGLVYAYPPTFPNFLELSFNEFYEKLRIDREVGKSLVKSLGLPPELVNEVLDEDIRKKSVSELTVEEAHNIYLSLRNFIESAVNNPQPVVVICDSTPTHFYPFKPLKIKHSDNCVLMDFKTFNEALDEYFTSISTKKEVGEGVEHEKRKLEKTLDKVRTELSDAKRRYSEVDLKLKIVEERYAELEGMWSCVYDVVKRYGWGKVRELCKVDEVFSNEGVYVINLNGLKLTFNILEDFKTQYFNLKRELKQLEEKIRKAEEKALEIEKSLKEVTEVEKEKLTRKTLLKEVQWYSNYHWIRTTNGFLAIGGRDAQQNEKIVRKYLSDRDIFMHADVHGASAFVILTEGREPQEVDLKEVAVLAASYSRGWTTGLTSVDVFWVWGSQVSKAAPPGQYLPKGSFMIYGQKNFIKNVVLKLSLGLKVIDEKYYEIVVGPEDLVSKSCITYITLTPGDEEPNSIAREFLKHIKDKTPYDPRDLNEDYLIRFIPGRSTIINFSPLSKC